MATVTINVAITAKGSSIAQGVNFTFAAGLGTPTNVVYADGKIDLSKLYPLGTQVALVFMMNTGSLSFTSGPSVGTFGLSFYGQAGASNAIWFGPDGQKPSGPNGGTEFQFPANAMGPNNNSLTVTDNNDDGKIWAYALFAWVTTGANQGQKFEDDPRIINHPANK